ncbi:dephospho-CoA kinase, partial [Streptomyces sp. NPDC058653]|uniref:dephospho-CoA kinase n=1 Tax=Streptomyces sp. NPDC058653 TaxID=3346576 RepID=UPI00365658D4
MLKVGLTGGIGAGKSEVSRLLVSYGAVLVDADKIAREVGGRPGPPGGAPAGPGRRAAARGGRPPGTCFRAPRTPLLVELIGQLPGQSPC